MNQIQQIEIKLKLYASLADYLPQVEQRHSVEIQISFDDTPHQVLERFNLPREMVHLVLLNGVYLEPAERDRAVFHNGDVLAIWPPVAGG